MHWCGVLGGIMIVPVPIMFTGIGMVVNSMIVPVIDM